MDCVRAPFLHKIFSCIAHENQSKVGPTRLAEKAGSGHPDRFSRMLRSGMENCIEKIVKKSGSASHELECVLVRLVRFGSCLGAGIRF
jgi:hypothetical protein